MKSFELVMYLTIHVSVQLERGLVVAVGLEKGLSLAEGPEVGLLPRHSASVPLQGLPPQNPCSAEVLSFNHHTSVCVLEFCCCFLFVVFSCFQDAAAAVVFFWNYCSFSFHFSLFCAFVASLHCLLLLVNQSLYSLNSAISASRLKHGNLLG